MFLLHQWKATEGHCACRRYSGEGGGRLRWMEGEDGVYNKGGLRIAR